MAKEFAGIEPHRKNLWGMIKNKLRSKDCTTVNKLIEAIISVWYHDDEIAKKLPKIGQFYAQTSEESSQQQRRLYIVLNVKIVLCFEQEII